MFGLEPRERLRRALIRAGVKDVRHLAPNEDPGTPQAGGTCAVLRDDWLYDERLVAALLEAPDTALGPEGERPVAAHVSRESLAETVAALRSESDASPTRLTDMHTATPAELVPAYNHQLRKFDPPFLLRARPEEVREAERRIFSASYKGATDLVTKWVWPLPALHVTRWLAGRGVRPNTVTAWSYVLTGLALWAFAAGAFAWGLVAAWLMTFLDTVDGKLARVTLTSSRLGNVLDHGLDLVHPPFWWAAWAVGLSLAAPGVEAAMWIIVVGYVAGRLLEGLFLALFKMEIFSWRPFDAAFRTVIARRNPNLLFLSGGVIAGRPDLGYAAVAGWTLASLAVHSVRLAQAFLARRRGEAIAPWYEGRESP
ncbi:MAG: CDP-alcohol phosphatidyltransferase family protein [Proteobacteria bacterium]|nr:CDP-alcohol phosphatidyltransferase family protein [Pseudomonadota bacterium]